MKVVKLFLILVCISASGHCQDSEFYYWYRGEKQPLHLKPDKAFLLLNERVDEVTLAEKLRIEKQHIDKIKKVELGAENTPASKRFQNNYWTIVRSAVETSDLLLTPEAIYYAPFFEGKNGAESGLSHLFYVKLHPDQNLEQLEALAKQHRVEILYNNKFRPLWYTLACDQNSTGNALEMANLFFETGLFAAAEPDLMPLNLIQSINDPFFEDQWNLHNTGQYGGSSGSDIQILDAWDITKSHSDIILAVLDHGIEMDHPDLPNIYRFSYDTKNETSPSEVHGSHGTAVAGIIGADTGNNEGISGIAPQGQLMSISNELLLYPGAAEDLADGIDYAWQHGAYVVNNSWGSNLLQSQSIDDAIYNAATEGRGGLGTIVVFASGNDNSSLNYPSANTYVIAVGAVSMCDERKSPTSCDTEYKWGSNYGTGLDVMAPGVLIPTTDRQSSNGFNPDTALHDLAGGTLIFNDYNNKNYTVWFNGTSAAAPHLAGIASLILSVNENLTEQEVREAIESTADKIGNYTYTLGGGERQGLTWNNEMGYGRVNAYKALIHTIKNHGAHLGIEMSQVTLPLYDDLTLHEDVSLESGSNLTIESKSGTVTITAASGTLTIGGPGGAPKTAAGNHSGNEHSDNNNGAHDERGISQNIPEQFSLSNNYPNPFNPTTVISYQLPAASQVTLKVFDMLGREVTTLVNGREAAGRHEVRFNASALSSGVYIYQIQAGEFTETKKMLLIK